MNKFADLDEAELMSLNGFKPAEVQDAFKTVPAQEDAGRKL